MLRSQIFDYHQKKSDEALVKIRVIENKLTLYFKDQDFDSLPNLDLIKLADLGFTPFNEQENYHDAVHVEDEAQHQAHIHLIKQEVIDSYDLKYVLKHLLLVQSQTMEASQHYGFFLKLNKIISESTKESILTAFKKLNKEESSKEDDNASNDSIFQKMKKDKKGHDDGSPYLINKNSPWSSSV